MAARRRTSLYQLRMTILIAVSALDETRPVRLRRIAFTIDCKPTDPHLDSHLDSPGHLSERNVTAAYIQMKTSNYCIFPIVRNCSLFSLSFSPLANPTRS